MSEALPTESTRLGAAFFDAIEWASSIHRDQARKGTDIPYVSHLLAVASLVLEDGGTEGEAIAALLHDAVEDQDVSLGAIEERFGPRVARIVEHCTDDTATDGRSTRSGKRRDAENWKQRKTQYLAGLEHADERVLRVSAADKLHNARALAADLRRDGPETLTRFNASRPDQLWYYQALADVFARRLPGMLSAELTATVAEMIRLADASIVSTPD